MQTCLQFLQALVNLQPVLLPIDIFLNRFKIPSFVHWRWLHLHAHINVTHICSVPLSAMNKFPLTPESKRSCWTAILYGLYLQRMMPTMPIIKTNVNVLMPWEKNSLDNIKNYVRSQAQLTAVERRMGSVGRRADSTYLRWNFRAVKWETWCRRIGLPFQANEEWKEWRNQSAQWRSQSDQWKMSHPLRYFARFPECSDVCRSIASA